MASRLAARTAARIEVAGLRAAVAAFATQRTAAEIFFRPWELNILEHQPRAIALRTHPLEVLREALSFIQNLPIYIYIYIYIYLNE